MCSVEMCERIVIARFSGRVFFSTSILQILVNQTSEHLKSSSDWQLSEIFFLRSRWLLLTIINYFESWKIFGRSVFVGLLMSPQISRSDPKVVTFLLLHELEVAILMLGRRHEVIWKEFPNVDQCQRIFIVAHWNIMTTSKLRVVNVD